MKAIDYLRYIVDEIHTVIVATVDDEGLPVTGAIDMMDYDESGLYFLTAKGKSFYTRLKGKEYMALTGIKGKDTMSCVAVSVRGRVKAIGSGHLPKLFAKNPYMNEIYPTEQSRQALTVFNLCEGSGEWFDLSKKPIERASFSFGDINKKRDGYLITESCIGCGSCVEVCPQRCLVTDKIPFKIKQEHCLHCGNCYSFCPTGAIIRGDIGER